MYFRAFNPDFKIFTARDLRRTCKTLMGEAGISKEIRDRIQNHALNDVSSKHYDRYDYLPENAEHLRSGRTGLITINSKQAIMLSICLAEGEEFWSLYELCTIDGYC